MTDIDEDYDEFDALEDISKFLEDIIKAAQDALSLTHEFIEAEEADDDE